MTGGTKLGMQIALLNVRAANGTVVANAAPSLKWWCQSSGLAKVSVWSCSAMISCCASRGDGVGVRGDALLGEWEPRAGRERSAGEGALRTLLGVSTVCANARGMQRPATNEELLAKMGAS